MIKLIDLINEFNSKGLAEEEPLTEEQKNLLLQSVSEYNSLGSQVYTEGDITQVAAKLVEISKYAEKYLSENVTEDFDRVTIGRNIKELKTYVNQFAKLAAESKQLNQRLQVLYEDSGLILQRYFEIKD